MKLTWLIKVCWWIINLLSAFPPILVIRFPAGSPQCQLSQIRIVTIPFELLVLQGLVQQIFERGWYHRWLQCSFHLSLYVPCSWNIFLCGHITVTNSLLENLAWSTCLKVKMFMFSWVVDVFNDQLMRRLMFWRRSLLVSM